MIARKSDTTVWVGTTRITYQALLRSAWPKSCSFRPPPVRTLEKFCSPTKWTSLLYGLPLPFQSETLTHSAIRIGTTRKSPRKISVGAVNSHPEPVSPRRMPLWRRRPGETGSRE